VHEQVLLHMGLYTCALLGGLEKVLALPTRRIEPPYPTEEQFLWSDLAKLSPDEVSDPITLGLLDNNNIFVIILKYQHSFGKVIILLLEHCCILKCSCVIVQYCMLGTNLC
jgi:hypothetical protein